MSNILENIKLLRERTGVGMMECKKVLQETGGDIDKAIELLRKAGQAKAVKKSARITAEGLIGIDSANGEAAIVEVNSETDFVARDNNFKDFVRLACSTVLSAKTDKLETIKETQVQGATLEKRREELVSKIGENVNIRRVKYLDSKDGNIATYLHGGRIGVAVVYEGGNESLAKDVAMHIAAINPIVMKPEEVSDSLIAAEKEVYITRAKEEGTPEDKVELRVQNQIKKFVSNSSLLGQQFVKDPSQTIEKFLASNSMSVLAFTRFEVGEGIEKKEENFAEEVMAQIK